MPVTGSRPLRGRGATKANIAKLRVRLTHMAFMQQSAPLPMGTLNEPLSKDELPTVVATPDELPHHNHGGGRSGKAKSC
jgi:hypothetical protein